ncbi:unnamed protein product, partial [marine sediment metagenome]
MNFYRDILYRYYDEGFILTRQLQDVSPKNKLYPFTDVDELTEFVEGKPSIYHNIMVGSKDNTNGKASMIYGSTLHLDLDILKDACGGDFKNYQTFEDMAIRHLDADEILCQYSAIVKSGGGLHVYYSLPEKTHKDDLLNKWNAFKAYAQDSPF